MKSNIRNLLNDMLPANNPPSKTFYSLKSKTINSSYIYGGVVFFD